MAEKAPVDLGGNIVIAKEFVRGYNTTGYYGGVSQTVGAGSTLTLTRDAHLGKLILLDTASGSTVTLPASTGSGDTYRFWVSTTVTSNNHVIKVANASDTMFGSVGHNTGAAASGVQGSVTANTGTVGTESDTITMNGTTSGGKKGTYIEIVDLATNLWFVQGENFGSGVQASVFSAGV